MLTPKEQLSIGDSSKLRGGGGGWGGMVGACRIMIQGRAAVPWHQRAPTVAPGALAGV